MLPSRRPGHRQLSAAQQIVELRPVAGIRRLQRDAIELPFARNSGMTIGMTNAHPQRSAVIERRPNIRALERVGISVVDAGAVGIELAAEQVVVEAPARPSQRSVAIRGAEISAVRPEG